MCRSHGVGCMRAGYDESQRTATAGILSRTPTCSRQHVFQRTQAWNSYAFQKSKYWKDRYRLDYILPRQTDRRHVRNVTVHRPPVAKPESDHKSVAANTRLLGRFTPNHRRRETKGRRAIDLQHLMASLQLRRVFIETFDPLLLARMLMEWQRRSQRRCSQPRTSHHVQSDVRDRGGGVLARK